MNQRCVQNTVVAFVLLILLLFAASCASTPEMPPEEIEPEPALPPDDPYQSVSLLVQSGNPEEAIAEFERADLESPEDPDTQVLLANLYIMAGQLDFAEELLQAVLGEHPDTTGAIYSLALIQHARGDRDASQQLLLDAIAIDSEFVDAHAALGEFLLEDNSLRAAQRAFEIAISIDESSFVARSGLGNVLLRQESWEEAVEELTRAIELQPNYIFPYVDRARAYTASGNIPAAIADYSTAIEIQPDFAFNYLDRGRLYARSNQPEAALNDFSMALEFRPDDFYIRAQKADVLYSLGRSQQASDEYVTVLQMRRDYHPAFVPLAVVSFELENWDRAHRFFREAFQRDNDRSELALAAALALKMDGQEQRGRQFLTENAQVLPRSGAVWAVARFYQNPGSDSIAIQEIQKLNSNQDDVKRTQLEFYMGAQYWLIQRESSARTYLSRVGETQYTALAEYRLAKALLERLE